VTHALRRTVVRPHAGPAELAAILALYAIYELGRGFGDATLEVARANTARIVELEQSLGVFFEGAVQDWASGIPSLPTFLGLAYVSLHLGATGAAMVWVHRRHRDRFALVRNALVLSTALSLVAYTLFPAAPPRLSGLGFVDTVTAHTHVNLSSDLLGSLYNPFAAVPSMHFGYALLVGFVVATTASNRWVRLVGALYPPFMLFDIVATGNHFVFDAAAGGLVTAVSWWAATRLERVSS
jgi:PAP2 superfamily